MSFDEFWSHYPNKKGKGAARKKFETLKKNKILPPTEDLIEAIHSQIKERKHLRSQNRFVPEWKHPSTWLNQECWTDVCFAPEKAMDTRKFVHTTQTLHRAYNVLSNLGRDRFESFCEQVSLCPEDREAVLNKHSGKFDAQRLVGGIG